MLSFGIATGVVVLIWAITWLVSDNMRYTGFRWVDASASESGEVTTRDSVAKPSTRVADMNTINRIKDDYLRLCEDIIFVIENNALFDSTVKETAKFNALFAADVYEMSDDTLHRHATDFQSAFISAKVNAQDIGLNALTSPDAGRRTVKMARKAEAEGVTEHERDALLKKVMAACETMQLALPLKTRSVLEQKMNLALEQ